MNYLPTLHWWCPTSSKSIWEISSTANEAERAVGRVCSSESVHWSWMNRLLICILWYANEGWLVEILSVWRSVGLILEQNEVNCPCSCPETTERCGRRVICIFGPRCPVSCSARTTGRCATYRSRMNGGCSCRRKLSHQMAKVGGGKFQNLNKCSTFQTQVNGNWANCCAETTGESGRKVSWRFDSKFPFGCFQQTTDKLNLNKFHHSPESYTWTMWRKILMTSLRWRMTRMNGWDSRWMLSMKNKIRAINCSMTSLNTRKIRTVKWCETLPHPLRMNRRWTHHPRRRRKFRWMWNSSTFCSLGKPSGSFRTASGRSGPVFRASCSRWKTPRCFRSVLPFGGWTCFRIPLPTSLLWWAWPVDICLRTGWKCSIPHLRAAIDSFAQTPQHFHSARIFQSACNCWRTTRECDRTVPIIWVICSSCNCRWRTGGCGRKASVPSSSGTVYASLQSPTTKRPSTWSVIRGLQPTNKFKQVHLTAARWLKRVQTDKIKLVHLVCPTSGVPQMVCYLIQSSTLELCLHSNSKVKKQKQADWNGCTGRDLFWLSVLLCRVATF